MKRRFRRWSGSVRQIAREPSFDRARVKGWSCERASRLACLRRTCRRANTRGAAALGSNTVRKRAGCGFVRFGRDGHRTQFGAVSLGEWAKGPGPGEAQCPAGRAARSACLRRSPGEDSTQSRFAQRDSCVSGMRLCQRPRSLGFRLSQSLAQGRRPPCVATQSSTCDHGVVSRRVDYRSGCAAIKPSASARQKPPRLRRKNCAASVRSIRRPSRSGSSSPIRSIWPRSSCPDQSAPLAHRTFPPLDHAAPAPARSFQSLAERSAGPNLDGSGHQPSRCPREAVKELSAAKA